MASLCVSKTYTELCIFQGNGGGKSGVLELYTRCLCQFVAAVASHSVSLLLRHFTDVLSVMRDKLLSNNMSQ